jgi:hypothetical protein
MQEHAIGEELVVAVPISSRGSGDPQEPRGHDVSAHPEHRPVQEAERVTHCYSVDP